MTEDPEINSLWRHKRRRGLYVVRGFCLIEAIDQIGILYRSDRIIGDCWDQGVGITWMRPLSEFMDGRFEPIAAPSIQAEGETP